MCDLCMRERERERGHDVKINGGIPRSRSLSEGQQNLGYLSFSIKSPLSSAAELLVTKSCHCFF